MNFLRIFSIIALILLTIIIGLAKPKLHKTFVIAGSDFKLQRYSEQISPQEIVYDNQPISASKRDVKIEPSAFMTDNKNIVTDKPEVKSEPVQELVNKKQEEDSSGKSLSKREEMIAWNKWRSDIQNEIMMKSQVDAPLGTAFYFSFKVDKFRHISNIKALCSNPLYQKEASNKIVSTIKSLEYTKILEFPANSVRDETTVRGMYSIGTETSLSNTGDFNDIERVNVYE